MPQTQRTTYTGRQADGSEAMPYGVNARVTEAQRRHLAEVADAEGIGTSAAVRTVIERDIERSSAVDKDDLAAPGEGNPLPHSQSTLVEIGFRYDQDFDAIELLVGNRRDTDPENYTRRQDVRLPHDLALQLLEELTAAVEASEKAGADER